MGFQLWENLLLSRLIPSVSSSLSALLLILAFTWLFRVRNPQTRYVLFHLPLIKGLLVLVRGVPPPLPGFENRLRFGIQLLDPFAMISAPSGVSYGGLSVSPLYLRPQWDTALAAFVLVAILVVAVGFLAYRWAGLVVFYRQLLSRPPATPESAPVVFRVLDRLVPAFGTAYPRVLLVEEPAIAPCTVGVRPPTIILSAKLPVELGEEQLEAVLAHELAHVSRRDGILHWPSLLLRDLLAFNPVAHRIFDRLLVEREKDSDRRAVGVTGRPWALARALVEVALLARGAHLQPAPGSMSLRQDLMGRTPVVEERVDALMGERVGSTRLWPLAVVLIFVFLALVRIYVHFPLAGHVIMFE